MQIEFMVATVQLNKCKWVMRYLNTEFEFSISTSIKIIASFK